MLWSSCRIQPCHCELPGLLLPTLYQPFGFDAGTCRVGDLATKRSSMSRSRLGGSPARHLSCRIDSTDKVGSSDSDDPTRLAIPDSLLCWVIADARPNLRH